MKIIGRCWMLLSVALLPFAAAAETELKVARAGQTRTYTLSELFAHPARTEVQTDASDEAYKRPMRYSAIPIEALLGDLSGDADASMQFTTLDGYAPVITAKRLRGIGAARAYLAIEPNPGAWPKIAEGKPSAGPFYLVWRNANGAGVAPSEWPHQIAQIRVQASLASRFPLILPDKTAQQDVWAGFEAYDKHCFACHTINRQGEARVGPDLNVPMNATEYFNESALRKLVRDPKNVRDWNGRVMPGFDAGKLSDAQLDNIIAYLKHMAGKKATQQ